MQPPADSRLDLTPQERYVPSAPPGRATPAHGGDGADRPVQEPGRSTGLFRPPLEAVHRGRRARAVPLLASPKRVLDVAGAVVGLMLSFPLCLLIALLIKLDSSGPVLFTQTRMGRNSRCFKMLKFRTMYVDAEARLHTLLATNPALRAEYETYHKLQNDPRVTRVGRWLRKLSLDELPQLVNILQGQMSLVGPRPYLPTERHKMRGADRRILVVRPGLTGFWQVFARNRVGFQERIQMDLHYLRVQSLRMDLHLLWRTVGVVLRSRDAS